MEQLAWDIGETAHALRRAFDRRAAELGITRAQWRVLARLDHQPGQRQVDLVERRRDPDDRRAWQLYLCEGAAPLVAKLHALAKDFTADVFGNLDLAEVE